MFDRVEDRLDFVGKYEIIIAPLAFTPLYQKFHYFFPVSGCNRLDGMPVILPEFVNLATDLEIFLSIKLRKVESSVHIVKMVPVRYQHEIGLDLMYPLYSIRIDVYKGGIVSHVKSQP